MNIDKQALILDFYINRRENPELATENTILAISELYDISIVEVDRIVLTERPNVYTMDKLHNWELARETENVLNVKVARRIVEVKEEVIKDLKMEREHKKQSWTTALVIAVLTAFFIGVFTGQNNAPPSDNCLTESESWCLEQIDESDQHYKAKEYQCIEAANSFCKDEINPLQHREAVEKILDKILPPIQGALK